MLAERVRALWIILGVAIGSGSPALGQATGSLDRPGNEFFLSGRSVPLKLVPPEVLPQPGASASPDGSPGRPPPPTGGVMPPVALPGPGDKPAPAPSDGAPQLALLLDTPAKGKYRFKDIFRVKARITEADAHLYIYDFGTSGTITELYPRTNEDKPLKAGTEITLDGTKDEQWVVSPPAGLDYVVGWVSTGPVRLKETVLNERIPGGPEDRLAKIDYVKNKVVQGIVAERGFKGSFKGPLEVEILPEGSGLSGPPALPVPAPAPSAAGSPSAQPSAAPVAGSPSPSPAPAASTAPGPNRATAHTTFPPEHCFALCVGINKYLHSGDPHCPIPELGAAVPDATAFRDKLLTSMKVPADNIHLVTDSAATKEGILKELEWLRSRAGTDSVAYLYWAGHGSTPLQPEGGEGESPTGLVTYDYDGSVPVADSHLLRDKEVGAWIDSVKGKGLIMVVDSCFCGAVTKGISAKRPLVPRGFFTPPRVKSRGLYWKGQVAHITNTDRPNTWVIEGAQVNQMSYEDPETHRGLLGGRVLDLFDQGLPAPLLFQRVQSWVSDFANEHDVKQTPSLVDNMGNPAFVPFAKN